MTTCTFAGHREVYQANISEKLDEAISKILSSGDSAFQFLVGGMGKFDEMCASAIRSAKKKYPNLEITLSLVLPYMKQEVNESKDYYELLYDDVIIPFELAGVHYKSAITKRNRWMVEQSDWLIAYVYREFGGALTTLHYAEKQGLQIINVADVTR